MVFRASSIDDVRAGNIGSNVRTLRVKGNIITANVGGDVKAEKTD